MGTRTVRLDKETEETLTEIRRVTGLSISEALKQGVRALHAEVLREASKTPYDVYKNLDLGPGGYAIAPSTESARAVRDVIRRKHGR